MVIHTRRGGNNQEVILEVATSFLLDLYHFVLIKNKKGSCLLRNEEVLDGSVHSRMRAAMKVRLLGVSIRNGGGTEIQNTNRSNRESKTDTSNGATPSFVS